MRYLVVLVFTTGFVTLGMELSASRLVEPAFGNNQIVWASLIGLILFSLAVGAWLGGRLADRFPHRRGLDLTQTLAAVGVALAPALSRPVLKLASEGMATFSVGLLGSSLLAVFLLFALPGVLLGTAMPWALRLALSDVTRTGHVAGRLSAISTAGSLIGTFVPVLWLIPSVGTRWTFFLLSLTLLTVIVLGSLRQAYRVTPILAWIAVLAAALLTHPSSPLDLGQPETGEVIFEDESLYNTIVVRQWGSERHLKLNEGIGLHSVYHPDMLLSQGIWDYFLLAPLFTPSGVPTTDDRLLLIGLAAGTVSELYTNIYGPLPITGVELDPEIIQVGQTYFNMNQPNLTPVAADGRRWLADRPADDTWRIIAVDAYRPPYIPFHLTTVEFFRLVAAHLTPDGVLAINVGRTDTELRAGRCDGRHRDAGLSHRLSARRARTAGYARQHAVGRDAATRTARHLPRQRPSLARLAAASSSATSPPPRSPSPDPPHRRPTRPSLPTTVRPWSASSTASSWTISKEPTNRISPPEKHCRETP